jgi:hypothetical protein
MNTIVQKISAPGSVDLSALSDDELDRLAFDEETAAAEKIKESAPFSEARSSLYREGYALINRIAREKAQRQGSSVRSYGAKDACCRLAKKLLCRHRRQTGKEPLAFYEAGVGTGLVVKSLLGERNLRIKGCDVCMAEDLKSIPQLDLNEGTIFDSLQKVADASIDLFYWNDVLEHIPDDEIAEYLRLIYRKMSGGGIVITITPNRLYGPCDVTRLFYPAGTKAKGFHFHEYTYAEVEALFTAHGFTPSYCIAVNPINRNYIIINKLLGVWVKRLVEKLAPAVHPFLLKRILLYVAGCHVSVFKK